MDGWKDVSDDIIKSAPTRTNETLIESEVKEHEKTFDGFDPKVHRTGKDGKPVIKKDGSFAKKPGGVGTKSTVGKTKSEDAVSQAPEMGAQELGKITAETFFALNTQFLGEAARPDDGDRESITNAVGLYLESKGIQKDIPPGVLLLLVTGGYYAKVLQKPQPRTKLARLGMWIKRRFKRGAHDDSRADGKREDDSK